MPQPDMKRPRRGPHPLRSVHRHHPFWGHVLLVLHWLWQKVIWWVWGSVIVGGYVVGALINWFMAGGLGLDPRDWAVWHLAEAHPRRALALIVIAAALTLLAWVGERLYQRKLPDNVELEFILRPVREVNPATPDTEINLPKYAGAVYLGRRDTGGGNADEKARAALRAAAKRPDDVPRETPIGICVYGQPALGKTRLAWEATRGVGRVDARALALAGEPGHVQLRAGGRQEGRALARRPAEVFRRRDQYAD